MAGVDQPIPRSYNANDLKVFNVSEHDILIDRIFIPNAVKSYNDAALRLPRKLGFYSLKVNKVTNNRVYNADRSELKYLSYRSGRLFDLPDGYNPSIVWGIDKVGLDHFLRWITENLAKFRVGQQLPSILNLNTDFVCYRGCLSRIMVTPFEKRDDWMIIGVKIGSTIYFHQLATEQRLESNANQSEHCNLLSYCGHSFEDMVCRGPDDAPGDKEVSPELSSGNTGQFCVILRSRLKKHSLLYAAEMDCIDRKSQINDPLDRLSFVEVKTTAMIHSSRQKDNFYRYKAIKWWAQSHLGAVDTILCGYRDINQCVRKIERIPVSKLADERLSWSPYVCLNFLDQFLTQAKQCIIEEKVAYRIYCSPGLEVTFTQTKIPVASIIPQWYLEQAYLPQPIQVEPVNFA